MSDRQKLPGDPDLPPGVSHSQIEDAANPGAGAPDFLALSRDHPVQRALAELVELCDQLDIAGYQIENAREVLADSGAQCLPPPVEDSQAEVDPLTAISVVDWADPGAELLDRSHRGRIRELLGVALTSLGGTVRGKGRAPEGPARLVEVEERVLLAALGAVETIDVELEDLLRGAEVAALARARRELLDAARRIRDFEAAIGDVEELLGKTKSDVLICRQRMLGIGAATGASPPPDPEVRSNATETRSTVRRVESPRYFRAEGFVDGPGSYRFRVLSRTSAADELADELLDDEERTIEFGDDPLAALVLAARSLGVRGKR